MSGLLAEALAQNAEDRQCGVSRMLSLIKSVSASRGAARVVSNYLAEGAAKAPMYLHDIAPRKYRGIQQMTAKFAASFPI